MSIPSNVSDDFIVLNPASFAKQDVEAARKRLAERKGNVRKAEELAGFHKPQDQPKKPAIRQKTKGMNKLETEFYEWLKSVGRYERIKREGIGIRLGNGVVYWPDFSCVDDSGRTIIWETKGRRHSTGQAKLKIAATMHPEWSFVYVEKIPKKDGGGFQFQEIRA